MSTENYAPISSNVTSVRHTDQGIVHQRFDSALIKATSDPEAVGAWLRARAARSTETYEAYARYSRAFLAYLATRGESLSTMTLETVLDYERHLYPPSIPEADQRLSRKTVDHIMSILSGMTSLLVDAGYIYRNPFKLRRRDPHEDEDVALERCLYTAEVEAMAAEITAMCEQARSNRERMRAERTRFCLAWFLIVGARISETLNSEMNRVYLGREGSRKAWKWKVIRKGRKKVDLPLRDDAMDALSRYRRSLGYPPLPSQYRNEGFLVQPLNGKSVAPIHRSTISRDLKVFFKRASKRLPTHVEEQHMKQATAHWLRHTAATQLLDRGASVRIVARLLGHSDPSTTSRIYDHPNRQEWRRQIELGPKIIF
ncbi:tyrosine-type recombinase/integrase [Salinisphaera hydrothermalis]|uniref:tyrosine-type recombinase/integrase n=1 Tax=Salinisphaera hydrothermalis TaxID=563188 RepID=UPI003341E18A